MQIWFNFTKYLVSNFLEVLFMEWFNILQFDFCLLRRILFQENFIILICMVYWETPFPSTDVNENKMRWWTIVNACLSILVKPAQTRIKILLNSPSILFLNYYSKRISYFSKTMMYVQNKLFAFFLFFLRKNNISFYRWIPK